MFHFGVKIGWGSRQQNFHCVRLHSWWNVAYDSSNILEKTKFFGPVKFFSGPKYESTKIINMLISWKPFIWGIKLLLMTFDPEWHWKVKSRSNLPITFCLHIQSLIFGLKWLGTQEKIFLLDFGFFSKNFVISHSSHASRPQSQICLYLGNHISEA